jgi:hypothetical protein
VHAAHPAQPGVVDEHVDALVVAKRRRHEGASLHALAHVHPAHGHFGRALVAALLSDSVQRIDATRAEHEVGALPRECERGRLPDAARRAGDDDDRPLEPHVASLGAP